MIVERVFAGRNISIERNGDAVTIHGNYVHPTSNCYRGSFACYHKFDSNGRKYAVVAPGIVYTGNVATEVDEARVSLPDRGGIYLRLTFSGSSVSTHYVASDSDLVAANTESTEYIPIAEVVDSKINQCQFGPIVIWWRFFSD